MAKNKVSPKRKVKAKEASSEENVDTTVVVAKIEEAPDNTEADDVQEDTEQGSEEGESSESEDSQAKDEAPEDSQVKDEAPEDSKKEPEPETKADEAKPSKAPEQGTKEKKLAGLIFMCKSSTKKDCFQYNVFGLPESKKDLVERVRPNMKLFLFDSDKKLLHGIYLATSQGGMNLEPQAFAGKSAARGFPAQVRFRVQKECLPLTEDVFKPAIKDNYFDKNRFNFELGGNQVKKLTKLFRPAPKDAVPAPKDAVPAPKDAGKVRPKDASKVRPKDSGKARLGPKPQVTTANRYNRAGRLGYNANGLMDRRARRELPYYEPGYRGISDLPPRIPYFVDPLSKAELQRLEYGIDAPYQDLYLPHRRPLARGVPDGFEAGQAVGNSDAELELLYRQRFQIHSDPRLDRGLALDPLNPPIRKRAFEEAFVDEHTLLLAKRQQLQDQLLYREHDYQRAPPSTYLATRYYAGV